MTIITILSYLVLAKKLIITMVILFSLTLLIPPLALMFGMLHYHFWQNDAQKENFDKDMMYWYE